MATKKTTTKKVTPAEAGWDKVDSVKAPAKKEVPEQPPVENSVPFGSPSELSKAIMEVRKAWNKADVPKNGHATTPTGNAYSYYLTDDVLDFVNQQLASKGYVDMSMEVENGMNIMSLTLDHYISGSSKTVRANLGSPTSMGDFGSRITYAPKYLLAIMFGISIQTDSDAFGTGINKNNQTQHGSPDKNSVSANAGVASDSGNNGGVPAATVPAVAGGNTGNNYTAVNAGTRRVEHSKSYPIAKSFIEKASSLVMLDQAETKVTNATGLLDTEKSELFAFIQVRRNELA